MVPKQNADDRHLSKSDGTYPYGYTFQEIAPDNRHFAFIVMSEWGDNGFPVATPIDIRDLMKSFFQNNGPGNTIEWHKERLYMPLLGSKVANLKGSKQKYAEWLAREFLDNLETCRVNHLVIVVRPHTLEDEEFHYPELNVHIQSYRDGQHHPEDIWAKYDVAAEPTGDHAVQQAVSL